MLAATSIQKRSVIYICGTIIVLLIASSVVILQHFGKLIREKIDSDLHHRITLQAQQTGSFFAERARIPSTLLNSPFFIDWFSQYSERGVDLTNYPGYTQIQSAFSKASNADASIKSVFFAPASTEEYFYEDGRVGVEESGADAGDVTKGYFTGKRPWWHEAKRKDTLYVTSPQVDATDQTVSSVIQTTVYDAQNKFLGVGGADILITTVGKQIDDINYDGQGFAFLLNEKGEIVYFPSDQAKLDLNQGIDSLDSRFSDTEGFDGFMDKIQQMQEGLLEVTWKGEAYFSVAAKIELTNPQINWSLALMVPTQVINDPIQKTLQGVVVMILVITSALAVIIFAITRSIVRPIENISNAMTDIAEGDGDLTKRLSETSRDEIGTLAKSFNIFINKIQHLIQQAGHSTSSVGDAAASISQVARDINLEVQQQKNQTEFVTHAVDTLTGTSQDISNSAAAGNEAVLYAHKQVTEGESLAVSAYSGMQNLVEQVEQTTGVVTALGEEADGIGEVVDVIRGIAEQTNLLALNAAIEAARAGEQGRGFAVVADEVRTLATRTRESTNHIQEMVQALQETAQSVENAMTEGSKQTKKNADLNKQIQDALAAILTALDTVMQRNQTIVDAAQEQDTVADNIREKMLAVEKLVDAANAHSDKMNGDSQRLNSVAQELQDIVSLFKV